MKIQLTTPKEFVIVPEKIIPSKTKTINEIEIVSMIDLPEQKKVIINTIELGPLELCTGDEYTQIGQWTDNDVENAILQKYINVGATASAGNDSGEIN